jgi:hypothetical protein
MHAEMHAVHAYMNALLFLLSAVPFGFGWVLLHTVYAVHTDGHGYLRDVHPGGGTENKMDHLACFVPGMLALGVHVGYAACMRVAPADPALTGRRLPSARHSSCAFARLSSFGMNAPNTHTRSHFKMSVPGVRWFAGCFNCRCAFVLLAHSLSLCARAARWRTR